MIVAALDEANAATLAAYYERTNSGDFLGVLDLLCEDVVYTQPGPPSVPYAGEWNGKSEVMRLFEAFGAAFGLVDMVETGSVASATDVFSINDEIFLARTTGQPWRVGVVHHIHFDESHLIARLDNYVDIAPALQALSGQPAIVQPITSAAPLPGQADVDDTTVIATIKRYYEQFPDIGELLRDDVVAIAPGDPRRLRFSGRWQGSQAAREMIGHFAASLQISDQQLGSIIADNGAAIAPLSIRGTFKPTGTPVELRIADLFGLDGDGRIGRISAYFDTTPLTHPQTK